MTLCDVCRRYPCIDPRCPNYTSRKATYYCSSCEEGIYEGEEYIENQDGEYRHYDCFYSTDDMLDWLGVKIKTMGGLI